MLDSFFSPKSVAVIGASRDPSKLGYAVVKNLIDSGFTQGHDVYPINPKADEILNLKAYPSMYDVPGDVELAIVVVPYKLVPVVLKECGDQKVPAAVIITAGFREAGEEGLAREAEIVALAEKYNIRVIGPNCLGVIDTYTPLNASFAAGTPPKGPIDFMSQSGALGTAVLDWSLAGRMGFSKFVSMGNKADIDEVDLMRAWADSENSNVMLAYIEGVNDGQRFINVAREVTKKKPVVVVKSGVTQAGSRAVASHTGSLAGSEQAYQAALMQAGVIRANTMQEMFDYALAFAYQPLPRGNNIAIVTNAGGPGILATDAIERAGLKLAKLTIETIKTLESQLPDAASAANPVDVLGDAAEDRYQFALEVVSKDPNVDAIIVILTPQAMTNIPDTAHATVKTANDSGIPIIGCYMGEFAVDQGVRLMMEGGVPNYSFPERAVSALKAMTDYRDWQTTPLPEMEIFDVDQETVRKLFDQVRADGRITIGDFEAREIMTAYGLNIPASEIAKTADEATEIAGRLGYPVVLKIASPDILHKTDVGGVKIGLSSPQDVRDAFDLMVYRAQKYVPGAKILGCLVQEMSPKGLEVLVGMNRDPQFGALVTFALGGIYVEILKDATFRVAPFARSEAEAMLREIRAHALLEGVRGESPKDKGAVVDTLLRVGQLVVDFPEIVELDINPLMVFEDGSGGLAIDMRLVLDGGDVSALPGHH